MFKMKKRTKYKHALDNFEEIFPKNSESLQLKEGGLSF